MAKRPTTPTPTTVTLIGPIQLQTAAPLEIRMASEPKQALPAWQHPAVLFAIAIFLVLLLALFWLLYMLPQTDVSPTPSQIPGIEVGYVAPKYLAVEDNGIVRVTVVNTMTTPLTVTVTLVFSDSLPVLAVAGQTSTVITNLPGGARATTPITFTVTRRPHIGTINFLVRARADDSLPSDAAWETVTIMPIRQLNLLILGGLSFLSSLWGAFLGFFGKRLFPD